jgi:hypothetical protein
LLFLCYGGSALAAKAAQGLYADERAALYRKAIVMHGVMPLYYTGTKSEIAMPTGGDRNG